ncbi:NUDIX hydrolase [Nocardioides lianchengensis]|uniref:ADP-ribose pyrophosphatase YjhB, NUDIX family n=1 Tax=Nocardioides lianchengensis TaxID=1045774 RepID=A0A1G6R7F5_9ACTN|nr:NUDIX hydrolase [Nocardioides lianchengensis]NYG10335.1 ADP-ribose pyrophosphatase YjhB (NUDIX family) [Nocardioides lianchengensis]SDD00559.1 ADP-ribose pyrophosphatase YjhB, NUDIX family [Nocardioides lianchengensis]
MTATWRTAVTAFTVTQDGPRWLLVRQERLGVTRWELPGGHVEPGETLEEAAIRETEGETGVVVEVGRLLATCVHEWAEQHERRLICFFEATATCGLEVRVPSDEPALVEVGWRDPVGLDDLSLFPAPLVEQHRRGWSDAPLHFRMTHRRNASGQWEPAPVPLRPQEN